MHSMLLFGTPEVIVVLLIAALVIFGGSRLAGVGKGAGQAIREFKEETEGLNKKSDAVPLQPGQPQYPVQPQQPGTTAASARPEQVYAQNVTGQPDAVRDLSVVQEQNVQQDYGQQVPQQTQAQQPVTYAQPGTEQIIAPAQRPDGTQG